MHIPGPGSPHVLPLNILWGGFSLDTTAYMVILWLLIPGPFALRRLLRLRRGLCPKCAYPMGESGVCTECGRALPSRVRVAYRADGSADWPGSVELGVGRSAA